MTDEVLESPLVVELHQLEGSIKADVKRINNLVGILDICKCGEDAVVFLAIRALHRIFIHLATKGLLDQPGLCKGGEEERSSKRQKCLPGENGSELDEARAWCMERLREFEDLLLTFSGAEKPETDFKETVLDVLFSFAERGIPNRPLLWRRIMKRLLCCNLEKDTLYEFRTALFPKFFLHMRKEISLSDSARGKCCEEAASSSVQLMNAVKLLAAVPLPSEQLQQMMEASGKYSSKKEDFKLWWTQVTGECYGKCWMVLLRRPLDTRTCKMVLDLMPHSILQYLRQPLLVADFLTDAFDRGGLISVLALGGIYELITTHNIEYPSFYQKLFSIFRPDILHMKYRSRFLLLAEKFLNSSFLPSYTVAAFVKRLSHLSLSAPPGALMIMMPLIYNLLRRFPELRILVHRVVNSEDLIQSALTDPYLENESELQKCGALESSLWELKLLRHHYLPAVANLAKIFEDASFSRPLFDLIEFANQSYEEFFDMEVNRRTRKKPTPLGLKCERTILGQDAFREISGKLLQLTALKGRLPGVDGSSSIVLLPTVN